MSQILFPYQLAACCCLHGSFCYSEFTYMHTHEYVCKTVTRCKCDNSCKCDKCNSSLHSNIDKLVKLKLTKAQHSQSVSAHTTTTSTINNPDLLQPEPHPSPINNVVVKSQSLYLMSSNLHRSCMIFNLLSIVFQQECI